MGDPATVFHKNPSYDGQLVRTLATASVHGADLGEALATARRIPKLEGGACYEAWSKTAAVAQRGWRRRQAGRRRRHRPPCPAAGQ